MLDCLRIETLCGGTGTEGRDEAKMDARLLEDRDSGRVVGCVYSTAAKMDARLLEDRDVSHALALEADRPAKMDA